MIQGLDVFEFSTFGFSCCFLSPSNLFFVCGCARAALKGLGCRTLGLELEAGAKGLAFRVPLPHGPKQLNFPVLKV